MPDCPRPFRPSSRANRCGRAGSTTKKGPDGEARMVGMTLFLTAFLAIAYFVLYSFLNLARAQPER